MNETISTPRERWLVNAIGRGEGLTREDLQQAISAHYTVSKPTLIRDLNRLIALKLIRIKGKGPAVRYYPASTQPLLRYFDLSQYFETEPDVRQAVKTGFDYGVFPLLKDLFTEAEKVELRGRSFSAVAEKLDPTLMARELERFVIELSWKSSKIEGNTYSLLETETLIKEARRAPGKSPDEATMILNHKRAFELILAHRAEFSQISRSTVTQLHNVLTNGLSISSGIRTRAVGITGTRYLPPDNRFQIEEGLEKMLAAINASALPLEKALIAVALISYLQPFADGNKRTGRMLANALLLSGDCFPLSYRSVDENEYKEALILFYEQGSLFHLKRIISEQYRFSNATYFPAL